MSGSVSSSVTIQQNDNGVLSTVFWFELLFGFCWLFCCLTSKCKITWFLVYGSSPITTCITVKGKWVVKGERVNDIIVHFHIILCRQCLFFVSIVSLLPLPCSSSPSSWSFSSPRWQLEWWPWRTPRLWVSAHLPPAPFVFYFHVNSHHIPICH